MQGSSINISIPSVFVSFESGQSLVESLDDTDTKSGTLAVTIDNQGVIFGRPMPTFETLLSLTLAMMTCAFCSVWTWHAIARAVALLLRVESAGEPGEEVRGQNPSTGRAHLDYREIMTIPSEVIQGRPRVGRNIGEDRASND